MVSSCWAPISSDRMSVDGTPIPISALDGCPGWVPRMGAPDGCPGWVPRMGAPDGCPG